MGKGYSAKPTGAGFPGNTGQRTLDGRGYDAEPKHVPRDGGNTGQRTRPAPEGIGIGQHRASGSGAPGEERGQRGQLHPGAHVGHYGYDTNGSKENMKVRATRSDADINTTSRSAGPHIFGEQPGADDQK